jgi:hypothetical protein
VIQAREKDNFLLLMIRGTIIFNNDDLEKGVVFGNRHKKTQKTCRSRVERFITKKVIARAV